MIGKAFCVRIEHEWVVSRIKDVPVIGEVPCEGVECWSDDVPEMGGNSCDGNFTSVKGFPAIGKVSCEGVEQ